MPTGQDRRSPQQDKAAGSAITAEVGILPRSTAGSLLCRPISLGVPLPSNYNASYPTKLMWQVRGFQAAQPKLATPSTLQLDMMQWLAVLSQEWPGKFLKPYLVSVFFQKLLGCSCLKA